MGNFYTNVVLSGAELDATVAALESMRRRAYVAADGDVVFVYDERCDDQDSKELERLASELSRKLNVPAVAFGNHDDDILWYALADGGKIVDRYDSYPGYFDGAADPVPAGGDARRLCAALGASAEAEVVEAVLRKGRDDVTFEVDRHVELLELLGVRPDLAVLGYTYVAQGEMADNAPDVSVRTVGGAPPV